MGLKPPSPILFLLGAFCENHNECFPLLLYSDLSIWMSHWRYTMVDAAKFWISYQQLAFLISLSHWQLMQNLAPSISLRALQYNDFGDSCTLDWMPRLKLKSLTDSIRHIDNYCVHFRRSDHQVDEAIFWESTALQELMDFCPCETVAHQKNPHRADF